MIASEFARLVNAKKVGKNRWIARCPSHPDKHPSLSITVGKKVPVLLKCQSQHCDTSAILDALGLTWQAVFDGKPTPEIRRRISLQEQKESLEKQLGCVIMLQAIDKRPGYWRAAESRIRAELFWVRWELEPERIEQEVLKWHAQRLKKTHSEKSRKDSALPPIPSITSKLAWSDVSK